MLLSGLRSQAATPPSMSPCSLAPIRFFMTTDDSQTYRSEPPAQNRWLSGIYNIADFAIDKYTASNTTPDVFDPAVGVSGIRSTTSSSGQPEQTRAHNGTLLLILAAFGALVLFCYLRRL